MAPVNNSLPNHHGRTISVANTRTALIYAFAAACMFLLLFFASAPVRHDHNIGLGSGSELIWTWLVAFAFVLTPYGVSFVLVSSKRNESVAAGAGVAAGFCCVVLVASPFIVLLMWFLVGMSAWNHAPDPGLLAAALVLFAFLAINAWIVWSAFRIGKLGWKAFLIALCATGLYVYVGSHQVMVAGVVGQRQAETSRAQAARDLYMPGSLAYQRLVSLTGCLLRNHMEHPEVGYPVSLEPPPPGWSCDVPFGRKAIKEFTFDYTPQADANGGMVNDFRLVAIPNAKGVNNRNPMMTDSRGIVFTYYPWEKEDTLAKVMVMESDRFLSQIDQLKSNIEQYANSANAGIAPAQLTTESMGALGHEMPTIEDGGMRLETRDWEVVYFPPTPERKGFALSARCKRYAVTCLRSFFLDSEGVVHGTGEPRQATVDDPPSTMCERVPGVCPDTDWSVP